MFLIRPQQIPKSGTLNRDCKGYCSQTSAVASVCSSTATRNYRVQILKQFFLFHLADFNSSNDNIKNK